MKKEESPPQSPPSPPENDGEMSVLRLSEIDHTIKANSQFEIMKPKTVRCPIHGPGQFRFNIYFNIRDGPTDEVVKCGACVMDAIDKALPRVEDE